MTESELIDKIKCWESVNDIEGIEFNLKIVTKICTVINFFHRLVNFSCI